MASLQPSQLYAAENVSGLRKRSVGTLEMQDEHGRRRTVELSDLRDEDKALAEQFGYQPVSHLVSSSTQASSPLT